MMIEQGQNCDTTASAAPFQGVHQSSAGDRIRIQSLLVPSPAEKGAAIFTDDFGGALLSFQVMQAGKAYLFGTAFMVMPGLAITASHVFEDFQMDGDIQLYLLGWRGNRLFPWSVTRIHHAQDVALVEIEPRFAIEQDFELVHFELTARLPAKGELVLSLGLVSEKKEYDVEACETLVVNPVAAAGPVIDWQEKVGWGRGVSVVCDFFGPHGMSGGPVFDREGRIFGVFSSASGEKVEDEFTCYVQAPWPAFMQNIHPQWPPGLYKESSLWPGHVADAWHLGLGKDEAGNMQVAYFAE